MAAFIRRLEVTNNRGNVNLGNWGNLQRLAVSKSYNGAGGNSEGTIVNGVREADSGAGERAGAQIEREDSGFNPLPNE